MYYYGPEHVQSATPTLRVILYVMGGLAALAILGGIGAIIWNAYSPTEIKMFGATVTTGHVGVAFTALGLLCMLFVIRRVLASVDKLAALPTTQQISEVRETRREESSDAAESTRRPESRPTGDQINLLTPILDRLDEGLQDALALAALQAKRDKKDVVSTRHVFAALLRLRDGQLDALIDRLPKDALPVPQDPSLAPDRTVLRQPLQFSGCVRESIRNLSPSASALRPLKGEDLFVDIARHGTGESVRRLRTHGVDAGRIQEIVSQLGWQLIERRAQQNAGG